MRVLCVIPARGGSKGIPGKNLRHAGGASLVGRAVFVAREFVVRAGLMDARVVVDTDSAAIAEEARSWGADVPFLRAGDLALDNTPTAFSILALLDRLDAAGQHFDVVVLLQPTSPARTAEDVLECWQTFVSSHAPVTTVTRESHSSGVAVTRDAGGVLAWARPDEAGITRRQESSLLQLTGAVYITPRSTLERNRAFVVAGETIGVDQPRHRAIDVDDPADLLAAAGILAGTLPRSVALGDRLVGPGQPCYVIAEAGVNHNGDVAMAHALVDVAAEAGADAVKFQTFDPELLVSTSAPKAGYQLAHTDLAESQHQMLSKLALRFSDFEELARHASDRGLDFLSTPFDERSADFLASLNTPALKVASGELTNHRLLAHLARLGKPLLISSGMATMAEVGRALEVVREHGNPATILFHCVSNYPADPAECNLRAMDSMRTMFQVPVGWSDHTVGIDVTVAAAALGADTIEKHFTLDRALPGPDHAASLEPDELRRMVAAVHIAQKSRGDGRKEPAPSEAGTRAVARRSLHAARDIGRGQRVAAEDLIALRPAGGVSPADEHLLLGRLAARAIPRGEMLREHDVL